MSQQCPDDHIITNVGTSSDIYFRATVESRSDISDYLLAIHGLSGADAVAALHCIGKATVVKVAKKGCFPLFCIGDVHAEIKSVEAQGTKFMCTAYGKVAESSNSMTECRVKMWRSKTGKSGASSEKLCSIPPTTEAFTEMCPDATFKWQYGRLHFLSHQKWTQQSMAGSLTT